jgi:hypothetical protein
MTLKVTNQFKALALLSISIRMLNKVFKFRVTLSLDERAIIDDCLSKLEAINRGLIRRTPPKDRKNIVI